MYRLKNSEFLKYYTLIESLPKQWKDSMKRGGLDQCQTTMDLFTNITKLKSVNKYLYNKQIDDIYKINVIKPQIKWENELERAMNWRNVFEIPFKCLIDTKLRTFQYKYLMRIIPNNKFLHKCNIISTSLCDFCCMHVETNKHLYWECQIIRAFWTEVQNYLATNNINILLNYEIVSFGLTEMSSLYKTVNSILIIAKYFIFKNKYAKTNPSIIQFIRYLNYIENLERLIAKSKNKTAEHELKWMFIH